MEALIKDYVPKALGTVVDALLKEREEAARDVLLDRLAKGKSKTSDIPDKEAAAMLFRYMGAAREGAARTNLKLLADVIVGQDSKPGFYANDFLYWSEVIASLRREEVILLGLLHREAGKIAYKLPRTGEFWSECLNLLKEERGFSYETSDLLAASLLRTGLVTLLGGLMDMGHAYMPTRNLEKLATMADLETYYMEEPYVAPDT